MADDDGFLLMDLLVALAVLAMVVGPLLGLFSVGAETLARSRQHTLAVYLAKEAVEDVKRGGFCAARACDWGSVEGFAGFERRVEVVDHIDGRVLKRVRVRVAWRVRNVPQETVITTYLTRR